MIELTDRIKNAEQHAHDHPDPRAILVAGVLIRHWRNGTPVTEPGVIPPELGDFACEVETLLRGEPLPAPEGFIGVPVKDRATVSVLRKPIKVEPGVVEELRTLLFEEEFQAYGYSSFIRRAVELARAELEESRS